MASKSFQAGVQRFRRPCRIPGVTGAEMSLARGATDHQRFHGEKARKFPPDPVDRLSHRTRHAFGQILADEKKRLDRPYPPFLVFQNEKEIVEGLSQGRANQFVKAVVLALVMKRLLPFRAVLQLRLS